MSTRSAVALLSLFVVAATATAAPKMKHAVVKLVKAAVGDAKAGKAVYAQNCQGCHGAAGVSPRPGMPNFSKASWQKEMSNAEIAGVVKNGIPRRMPAFGGRLSAKQQKDVVAYVRALGKGAK